MKFFPTPAWNFPRARSFLCVRHWRRDYRTSEGQRYLACLSWLLGPHREKKETVFPEHSSAGPKGGCLFILKTTCEKHKDLPFGLFFLAFFYGTLEFIVTLALCFRPLQFNSYYPPCPWYPRLTIYQLWPQSGVNSPHHSHLHHPGRQCGSLKVGRDAFQRQGLFEPHLINAFSRDRSLSDNVRERRRMRW